MKIHRLALASTLTLTACSAADATPEDATEVTETTAQDLTLCDGARGHVYALSNELAGNAVLVFDRARDGKLTPTGRVQTGGLGSDDGLGSQGSLVMSQDGDWLLATNAGNGTVSLLRLHDGVPRLANVVSSGGDRPVSVTERRGLVYVLNAGANQNITGLRLHHHALVPIADSTRALSASTSVGAAEIGFSPRGDALVVTEKATNALDGFTMRSDGTPSDARVTPSAGNTPFGFAFDWRGALVVSDAFGGAAGAGAVSSYTLDATGGAQLVTGPLKNGQGAPCWVVTTRDARFAYSANTGSGTISGFSLDVHGALTGFGDGGATASTGAGSKPADMTLTGSGAFLYVRNGDGTVAGFHRARNGALTPAGAIGGLPAHTAGIVAD
jgi:6-phosphogluconolactonase